MIFIPTPLKGSYEIKLAPHSDHRGWLARFFDKDEFAKIGHTKEWVQMNHSFTASEGAIRGMHFQLSPFQEIKVVRCIAGSIYDVMVDLRKKSPTFLQWFGIELSPEKMNMIYIPEGFAHGFQTLTEGCELLYLHSEFYKPDFEKGVRFNDPAFNINWTLPVSHISSKDQNHTLITDNFEGI